MAGATAGAVQASCGIFLAQASFGFGQSDRQIRNRTSQAMRVKTLDRLVKV